jgi:tyrocidine synthetase-3
MTTIELMRELKSKGISISLSGSDLKVHYEGDTLPDDVIRQLRSRKAEITAFLQQIHIDTDKSIPALPPAESYALSSSQLRLWILGQFEGGVAYNLSGAYVFDGTLNEEALEASLHSLIERHEILRTVFREDSAGNIRQIILSPDSLGFGISRADLRGQGQDELSRLLQEESSRPFDLFNGPLLRVTLYRVEEQKWIFSYVKHHIISDGWSMHILIRELFTFYHAYSRGAANPLKPLRIQYKDYAAWQQEQLNNPTLKAAREYWLRQFEGALPVLELPADYTRPAVKTFNGSSITRRIDPSLARKIKAFSQEQGGTLFMGMLSAVYALLYRYTGQEDIIIGTPVAGREHEDLADQIGFYVNTLALRGRFSGKDNFRQLFDHVRKVTLGAFEHQLYPLDQLISDLDVRRDMSRNALFDVLVTQQIIGMGGGQGTGPAQDAGQLRFTDYDRGEYESSQVDLSLDFMESGDELLTIIQYNTDIYKESSMQRLAYHLEQLLDAVMKQPSAPLSQLDYLTAKEKRQLVEDFNDTAAGYRRNKTINVLFEEQVRKTPDAIALVFEQKRFTWQQLNEQSNRLAHYLRAHYKIQPGDRLAICLERGPRMIIALLAVLKSGGAYVPIDPQHPQERISYMLEDSKSKVLIHGEEMERFRREQYSYSTENPQPTNKPTDLMYILYTSGSTGKPKGCMLEHGGVVNRIEWMWQEYGFNSSDIIMQKTTFTFDVSVWELFLPLCWGARMVLCHCDDIGSPERILALIEKEQVTCLHFVPGMLQAFISWVSAHEGKEGLRSLRKVMASGEALGVETVRSWYELSDAPLHNLYGPTEASIDVSYYATSATDSRIPIGRPIWNTQLYILGEHQQVQPLGVAGEICIGGEGLARGYWNRAELTAEKFVRNPFRKGERIYRTGDLGRWLEDGTIEYLGRKDEQVKVRGYRIELGEIEAALQSHPLVSSCVVVAKAVQQGEKELVAYMTGEQELNASELRSWLDKTLPHYMVPSHYVQLEAFPLTTSGKVDRKALPDPEGLGLSAGTEYVGPRNETEAKLVQLWQEILGVERIGVKDNFFTLGGHSLKMIRLGSQVHKQFHVKIELKDLFIVPVLEDQARLIGQSVMTSFINIEPVEQQEDYALSSSQRRLWILSQFEEASMAYNMGGVYVFDGALDLKVLQASFASLVERHESLRTTFRENRKGEARQVIHTPETSGFSLNCFDFRGRKDGEREMRNLVHQEQTGSFNLTTGPLLRASLFRMNDSRWVFSYVMHHIISDGWSMNILVKELLQLYTAYAGGAANPLTPLRIQYKDYAAWQQQQIRGEGLHGHKEYWLKQFEGDIPVLELPSDKPRPAMKTYNGRKMHVGLDAELGQGLRALSQQQGGTLFMGILAAVKALLYRYTGQGDIVVGTPTAGRAHADLEDQIGFYVNTLPLRSRFSGEQSFQQLLDHVKQVMFEAYEHQVYPFDELVEALNLRRDISRNPLFDVLVGLQNNEQSPGDAIPGFGEMETGGSGEGNAVVSKFDLSFDFIEAGEEIHLLLGYNSDIYAPKAMEALTRHLRHLVSAIIREPQKPLRELDYLAEEEKQELLSSFNNTSADYPRDRTVVELFAEQAEKTPENTAMVFEGMEITYRELHEKSNQLANYLKETYDIRHDDMVGIMLERSEKTIIAILGVLKSGAAYVPIDADFPDARKEFIIKDTGVKALITQSEYSFGPNYFNGGVFAMDLQLDILETSTQMPRASASPSALAYVMYTSGSTGKPKGVMIEHRSMLNYLLGFQSKHRVEVDFLFTSNISFDASLKQIFLPLISGRKVHVYNLLKNLPSLPQYVQANSVRVLNATPAVINELLGMSDGARLFETLEYIIIGGEAFDQALLEKLRSHNKRLVIINAYGPTETCANSLTCELGSTMSLGTPIANTTIYLLDQAGLLVPAGVAGEICIGGDGLARGYLNRPELTLEKFVDNPYKPGTKMYMTGDLGRWLPDGTIEFMGRRDDQVKIRGHRIELGEIENAFHAIEAISAAVVIAKAAVHGGKELVAYIVAKQPLTAAALRAALAGHLPAFMIPARFVLLEQLPLTSNGKVDRKRLPDPESAGLETGVEYVAPRTEMEEKLALIWQEVLGRESIGVKDDYFDLGGNSLNAMRVIKRLIDETGFSLSIKVLFTEKTIENIAQHIRVAETPEPPPATGASGQDTVMSGLSFNQLVYFSDHRTGNEVVSLDYELESIDMEAFRFALGELVRRQEVLRTVFVLQDGAIRQRVIPVEELSLEVPPPSVVSSRDEMQRLIASEQLEFGLNSFPLFFCRVYKLLAGNYCILFTMHHIITDGYSGGILIKELVELYTAALQKKTVETAPPPFQYRDFCAWQHGFLNSPEGLRHQGYWLNRLKGYRPVEWNALLPAESVPATDPAYRYTGIIQGGLSDRMDHFIKEHNLTRTALLMGVMNLLVSRMSGRNDTLLVTNVSGRNSRYYGKMEVTGLVGLFANQLLIRNAVDSGRSVAGHLLDIRDNFLDALGYQDYPFWKLVNELPDVDRAELLASSVFLNYTNFNYTQDVSYAGSETESFGTAKYIAFAFGLAVTEYSNCLRLDLLFNSRLFSSGLALETGRQFFSILRGVLEDPSRTIGELMDADAVVGKA